ncbi:GIY-YIG nuclease family protein [Kroppenstedtia pulmonis]|uniref:GIY-YIG nuclease family protein n=1 Tax=Kroppenstedtia pulmonis TaxID=1380685 RepID=A0A7D3XZH9_9BACL|nr:GIY-YIG nuclease family protein [Kroppenstedtia pulmonis]QKG83063.1 GIY-YIG nuclease family protein [Kroppenstedtia pulmonis]
MEEKEYVVYILECADGTLYTGVTTNLPRRLEQHRAGTGAKYTRGRGPLHLKWVERGKTRSEALRREREIKAMKRPDKDRLIQESGLKDETPKKFSKS